MGHFFMESPPNILHPPIAALQGNLSGHELGLKLGRAARNIFAPHISGYVGADVVAGILASVLDRMI